MKALTYVAGGIFAALVIAVVLASAGYGAHKAFSGSSSSSAPLHLASGDVSESDYRASIRASLLDPLMASQCSALKGLSGQEAFKALSEKEANDIASAAGVGNNVDPSQLSDEQLKTRVSVDQTAEAQLVAIATESVSNDAARAGGIILEECARIQ